MELLHDPQAWLSFLLLTALEIILGVDNVVSLSILVGRLPAERRPSARLMGLGFAMLTRLALLGAVTSLANMRQPLFSIAALRFTVRGLILFVGGAFLLVGSVFEIRKLRTGVAVARSIRPAASFWLVILQVGLLDVVFSLDSVFTAVGVANQFEVMAAAIITSILVMMLVASAVGEFIDRYPTVKLLALTFLGLVGGSLIGEAVGLHLEKVYLYVAMACAAAVAYADIRRRRRKSRP